MYPTPDCARICTDPEHPRCLVGVIGNRKGDETRYVGDWHLRWEARGPEDEVWHVTPPDRPAEKLKPFDVKVLPKELHYPPDALARIKETSFLEVVWDMRRKSLFQVPPKL